MKADICIEITLQIPLSRHTHEPSSFNTKRRDSKERSVISTDPPPKFRGVVTASGGDGCFFLCIRGIGSVCRNSIVRILAGRTDSS